MEISVLQSAIKRNSNLIKLKKYAIQYWREEYFMAVNKEIAKAIANDKKDIKALTIIQKALKKELAKKIRQARLAREMSYWRNR